jgi:toxin CcdB
VTQLAVHRLRTGGELVCRIQADFGVATAYVLCAPVVAAADWGMPVPRLHLPVQIDGLDHLILMTQMVALPAGELGTVVGSAAACRDAVVQAVDLLVTGF